MIPRLLAVVLTLAGLTACPENIDFFFFSNGQVFNDVLEEGNGIIIGVGTEDAESSELVAGDLPLGMTLQPDGTVTGIPEETGLFEFTIETVDFEGLATLETHLVEIEE